MTTLIGLVLLLAVLILFHRQVFGALQEIFEVPARLAEHAEELLHNLCDWVGTLGPSENAYDPWGVFQGVIVAAGGAVVAYADYVILKAAFLLLLPDGYAKWLAVTGTFLTGLTGFALHAGRSRAFRMVAVCLSILLLATLGFLAWMRATELHEIKRQAAVLSSFEDTSESASLSIAGEATPPDAPREEVSAMPSAKPVLLFGDALLSACLAVLYGLGGQAATFLAMDLAREGLLAVALTPLRMLVWLPLAPVTLLNASGLLRLPGKIVVLLASVAAQCAVGLKDAPDWALSSYEAWRERAIRRRFKESRLLESLENEAALRTTYLVLSREAQSDVLRRRFKAQAAQQIQLHEEILAEQREEAMEAIRLEYRDFLVPCWTKLQSVLDSSVKSSTPGARMTQ